MNLSICSECGNEVKLLPGKNRSYQYKYGIFIAIPNDYLIPTCVNCKEEFLIPEISEKLNKLMSEIFEEKLISEVASLKEQLLSWKDAYYIQREATATQSWMIPYSNWNFLKLNNEQKEEYFKFLTKLK